LGTAIAAALARHELDVVLTARRHADAVRATEQLGIGVEVMSLEDAVPVASAGGRPRVMPAGLDVTDPVSVAQLFTAVERHLGHCDVLVNNAAIAIDKPALPSRPDFESLQATFDVNLLGAMRCCAKAVPLMRAGHYGRITNISSHMGSSTLTRGPGSPAYAMSKAVLGKYTTLLAAETRRDGILVNAASPDTVATRMNYGSPRYTPDEAAERLVWLSLLDEDGPTGAFFSGRDVVPW
jgi:NAD(P)-dependent dehydrogenase (short-subunit alcohol dehydrogenase family)